MTLSGMNFGALDAETLTGDLEHEATMYQMLIKSQGWFPNVEILLRLYITLMISN